MPTHNCPLDPLAMDGQVQHAFHRQVNGGHHPSTSHRSTYDDELQYLSREEKECILFFEETIDSLEESLKEEELEDEQEAGLSSGSNTPVEEGSIPTSPLQSSTPVTEHPVSPRENDIIDLVHSLSGQTKTKDVPFEPTGLDFQSMTVAPESHFEHRAKRGPVENFPPDYPPPPPVLGQIPREEGNGSGSPGGGGYQPPPGSVPTPVLIAQKIAEHQGDSMLPSMLVKRRRSLDSSRTVPPSSHSGGSVNDQSAKHGPPTSAKPNNVAMLLGNRELTSHSVAMAAVSERDRRAQILAGLSGTGAHPMEGGEPPCRRNLPTRSVSFRDPTPDKSHMEALSKLGLIKRSRAMSMTPTLDAGPAPAPRSPTTHGSPNTPRLPTNHIPHTTPGALNTHGPCTTSVAPTNIHTSAAVKAEMHTDFNRFGGKSTVVTPSHTALVPSASESLPLASTSADVASKDFNSYGGKTITVVPAAASSRADSHLHQHPSSPTPPTHPVSPPPVAARTNNPSQEVNIYGGKTKTIVPILALARGDAPDGPAAASTRRHSQSPSPPSTIRVETATTSVPSPGLAAGNSIIGAKATSENNYFGGKTKVFNPAPAATPTTVTQDSRPQAVPRVNQENSFGNRTRAVVPTPASPPGPSTWAKPSTGPPPTAYKPQSPHRVKLPSPEVRRKSLSGGSGGGKPSFRSQGITVQFSGRGATDESRREALRKLGLLKDETPF